MGLRIQCVCVDTTDPARLARFWEEVSRLEQLGARRVDVGQGLDVNWFVMADPVGNEFCVLRTLTRQELFET